MFSCEFGSARRLLCLAINESSRTDWLSRWSLVFADLVPDNQNNECKSRLFVSQVKKSIIPQLTAPSAFRRLDHNLMKRERNRAHLPLHRWFPVTGVETVIENK